MTAAAPDRLVALGLASPSAPPPARDLHATIAEELADGRAPLAATLRRAGYTGDGGDAAAVGNFLLSTLQAHRLRQHRRAAVGAAPGRAAEQQQDAVALAGHTSRLLRALGVPTSSTTTATSATAAPAEKTDGMEVDSGGGGGGDGERGDEMSAKRMDVDFADELGAAETPHARTRTGTGTDTDKEGGTAEALPTEPAQLARMLRQLAGPLRAARAAHPHRLGAPLLHADVLSALLQPPPPPPSSSSSSSASTAAASTGHAAAHGVVAALVADHATRTRLHLVRAAVTADALSPSASASGKSAAKPPEVQAEVDAARARLQQWKAAPRLPLLRVLCATRADLAASVHAPKPLAQRREGVAAGGGEGNRVKSFVMGAVPDRGGRVGDAGAGAGMPAFAPRVVDAGGGRGGRGARGGRGGKWRGGKKGKRK